MITKMMTIFISVSENITGKTAATPQGAGQQAVV